MNSPTPAPMKPDDLDRALTEMTAWKGVEPELWKAALKSSDADPERGGWKLDSILSKPLSNRLMLAGVGCIAVVFVVAAMLPSIDGARDVRRSAVSALSPDSDREGAETRRAGEGFDAGGLSSERQTDFLSGGRNYGESPAAAKPDAASIEAKLDEPTRRLHQGAVTWAQNNTESYKSADQPAASAAQRYVVQKANMDLQTDDVRAAFAKAAHLVSEAGGEFVENSSLTGEDKTAQGNMTLRVAAARVGEVMNKLRELGTVKSENTSGEDVTTQVVDVEARIRNEQRVEKELLDLLEKRHDAPLKDILELRSSLSSVRESIERLVGQRDRLGRLVSLASILVVIRAEPLIEKPAPASTIGDYFAKAVDRAWRGGLQSLSDTVAWIVAVAIGGVMWWIALAAAVVAIVRWRRRLSARCV